MEFHEIPWKSRIHGSMPETLLFPLRLRGVSAHFAKKSWNPMDFGKSHLDKLFPLHFRGIFMEFQQTVWNSVKFHEIARVRGESHLEQLFPLQMRGKCFKIHEISWNFATLHAIPWNSADSRKSHLEQLFPLQMRGRMRRNPWNSLKYNGIPWSFMKLHGFVANRIWSSYFHSKWEGKCFEIHEIPWNFVNPHGFWETFETYGIPIGILMILRTANPRYSWKCQENMEIAALEIINIPIGIL